jgi:chromate transporter
MQRPSFRQALQFWFKLGFISFGGPAGQIAIMHEYLVEKKKWISDSKFLHALNYCMLLPGPEAQQLAIYTGWLLHGLRGGLAAGILFVFPSMFVLLGLSVIYVSYGNIPWIYALFYGLKPAVIAIVCVALYKIGKKALLSPFHYFIALAAFIGIYFLNIPFPLIMISAIFIALAALRFFPGIFSLRANQTKVNEVNESDYYINNQTVIADSGFKPVRFARQLITGVLIWLIPLAGFYVFTSDFKFWKDLSLFFTQAALVTFGGAYAVLPYVAQVSVEKYHWLSSLQMIDGLALGETTPGPLIMILAYVGFMAGYHHFGQSLIFGSVALITTTYYTFLPSFLYILIGAPVIEKTQDNKKVKAVLGLVSAAVVGVVLNLTIYLTKAVLFPGNISYSGPDLVSLGWAAISFIVLFRFQFNIIAWIGISALFGLSRYLFLGN